MRVLLIVHDNYQEDNHLPLGPLYLATVLKDQEIKVDIYSMDVYHYTNKQLADYLDHNEYDLIGVGFMAARFNETIVSLCDTINRHKKNAWLVLGGHGPSPIPQYMIDKVKADCIMIGESEYTFFDILNDKQNNNNRVIYHGERVKKLDDLPELNYDLLPIEKYSTCFKTYDMKPKDRLLDILSSRGCVNRCSFCYRLEKGIRLRSIDKVTDEMKHLNNKYGINYFFFADELFVLNKKRLELFMTSLQDKDLNIKYWCSARVNLIDDELLNLMKDTGCTFINYGFESMDNTVLNLMNKNTTPEENENAAYLTKKANIPFGLNFIWNNPGDTIQTLHDNKKFIMKYNLYGQLRTIRPVTPYPGSDLYYQAIKDEKLDGPEDFFNKFKNSDLILVNFTDLEEKVMYRELYKTNKELIYDHYNKTSGDMKEANYMIDQFHKLYFEGYTKFRGARHYDKGSDKE